ncbi:hypothetical protein [Gracilimonas mengyeensis]|uniref:Uncharacterized protein n=1 Tax=Gracilimonas mengyeensis TaxID=1302730 RepID=A0A521BMN1_9BACT|nr:hypothetical protein [Gracilimonas mengyeensis]SMO48365.1 hypothetical protein SAMN06265219_102400 [Gracilimonas mengyeensis]
MQPTSYLTKSKFTHCLECPAKLYYPGGAEIPYSRDNSISLNLTNGFPADFLKLNIICTFNTKLDDIDPALLREGRLKGIHKFEKLSIPQAEKLADHLGKEIKINQPMTLAEVCNAGNMQRKVAVNGIGF